MINPVLEKRIGELPSFEEFTGKLRNIAEKYGLKEYFTAALDSVISYLLENKEVEEGEFKTNAISRIEHSGVPDPQVYLNRVIMYLESSNYMEIVTIEGKSILRPTRKLISEWETT